MEMQGMAQLSKMPSNSRTANSMEGKLPGRDGILTLEVDAQNEDLTHLGVCPFCVGEQGAALDAKTDERNFEPQVLKVHKATLPVSETSRSLESLQTVSTELYIPPIDCKAESLLDSCVSRFKNDLEIGGLPSSPVEKVEDRTPGKPNCRKRTDGCGKHKKRRKRSQTELAVADVEAAVGRIVNAAEAMVVSQLIDSLSLSSLDRSTCLEAALSLAKARHLCGLDKYELSTTTMASEELAIQDLDHPSMQQAYEDVGIVVDVEDKRQLLGVGTDVVNLCQGNLEVHARPLYIRSFHLENGDPVQNDGKRSLEVFNKLEQNLKSVERGSCSSEIKTGPTVAEQRELKAGTNLENTKVSQETDKAGDKARLRDFGMNDLKESREDNQLHAGLFSMITHRVESGSLLTVDAAIPKNRIKEPPQTCKSLIVDSLDSEIEIRETVAGDRDCFNVGRFQQDTEVLQESDTAIIERNARDAGTVVVKECREDLEVPTVALPTISCLLQRGHSLPVDREKVVQCSIQPTQSFKSSGLVSCTPENKEGETVTQAHKNNQVIKEALPETVMVCADLSLQLGSMSSSMQQKAVHQEGMMQYSVEVEAKDMNSTKLSVEEKTGHYIHTRDLHAELSLCSQAMVSKPRCTWPDADNNPLVLKVPPLENATTQHMTPYISRWFGGWSGKAVIDPAADVAEEEKANDAEEGNRHVQGSFSPSSKHIGSDAALSDQNSFLGQQISVPLGREILNAHKGSLDLAGVANLPQSDASASERDETGDSQFEGPQAQQASTLGPHVSLIDPLCSFVPCSISPPTGGSLPLDDSDHKMSRLATNVEACARAVMNIIDSRKEVDYPLAGAGIELHSVQDPCARTEVGPSGQQSLENPIASVTKAKVKAASVKRRPTSMKTFSTTNNSISLLLDAVDIAGKSLSRDHFVVADNLEGPSTMSPTLNARSPPLASHCPEGGPMMAVQSADCDPEMSTVVPDVTLKVNGKGVRNKRGMNPPDLWMSADLSDSPPLLWPRGMKRRLTACRIMDSDSIERLPDNVNATAAALAADEDEDHTVQENSFDKEQRTLQNGTQRSVRSILRISTRSKQCHDLKSLFKGLHFLLTGFSAQMKEKLSKSIEQHGGALLANIPAFSPKQRFRRRGLDCGARSPPIVVAPQQVRTPKFLYGCAVGSPLLHAGWINASISAATCLPYHKYQHKQTRKDSGGASKDPLFVGFQFLFHGQQDFISQLSTLAKHAGGKVIRKLVLNGSDRKQGQKLVGLLVLERSSNFPLDLQRAASQLKLHVVDAEWMVLGLLNGKLLPLPTKSAPLSSAYNTQQSSSSKTLELQSRSLRQNRLPENLADKEDEDSGIEIVAKKPRTCSLPDEIEPNQSIVRANLRSKESQQVHVDTWLGKGFTSPPQVPELADGIMSPYSSLLALKKLPKKFLYYDAFLCNGVEYFLGDNVEVRTSTAGCELPSVVRLEGLWCEEGRLPQTRAFHQGVRKKAFKNLILKCRRFYRPSDTGFPGQGANELYLSNNIENNVLASDVLRRVRVALGIVGKVVHCRNWYEDQETASTGQQGTSNTADYMCSFFYDHARESLHRIKFEG